jgi:hypothetical protein
MDINSVKLLFETLALIIVVGGNIIILWKAFKTAPKEVKSSDADLSVKYQELADRQLERANEYEVKLDDYKKITSKQIETLTQELDKLKLEMREIRVGVKALVLQIVNDFHGVPVWIPEELEKEINGKNI